MRPGVRAGIPRSRSFRAPREPRVGPARPSRPGRPRSRVPMSASDRNAAFAHFRAGRLAEAESACRAIVARDANDAEALHLLGFILATSGRRDEGLPLLDRS